MGDCEKPAHRAALGCQSTRANQRDVQHSTELALRRNRSDVESANESQHNSFPIGKSIVGRHRRAREGAVHKRRITAIKRLYCALVIGAFAPNRENRLPLMAVDSESRMSRYPVTLESLGCFHRERSVPAVKEPSRDGKAIGRSR